MKIVISYRRQYSLDITMRLRDAMVAHFGKESVFTDIDNIPYGIDFRPYLNWEISTCDAMIAVVGPHWVDAGQGPGQGLHLEKDFVRIEVEAALKRGIPVIPALVAGTRMPGPNELPDVLRDFAFCNGAPIDSGVNFHNDVERIIESLDNTLAPKRTQEKRQLLWANTLASIGILGTVLTYILSQVPAGSELGQILAMLTPASGLSPFAMPIFLAIAAWGVLGKFAPPRTLEKGRIDWSNVRTAIGILGAVLVSILSQVPAGSELGQILAMLTPASGLSPFAMPIFLAIAAWGVLGKFAPPRTQEKGRIDWSNVRTAIGILGAVLVSILSQVPAGSELGQILAMLTPASGLSPFAMPIFLAIAAWGVLGKFRSVLSSRRH